MNNDQQHARYLGHVEAARQQLARLRLRRDWTVGVWSVAMFVVWAGQPETAFLAKDAFHYEATGVHLAMILSINVSDTT